MAEQVVIERRFRGPPLSGQGGYSAGLVAERIASDTASVSLRLPPPLERPLTVERDGDQVRLLDGDLLVAEGAPAELDLGVPAPVTLEAAREAEHHHPWKGRHPFPECFGCGPERSQDEAVAITIGAVQGATLADHPLYAGAWTPLAEFAGEDGAVAPLYTWSALDCPTGWPAIPPTANVSVLARLTCKLIAPIEPAVTHTVIAWHVGSEGRKHRGAAAIHSPGGALCAYGVGLWIELRDPATMGAKT